MPIRVAITGASGLVGAALQAALVARGDTVIRLVRRTPGAPDEVRWNPSAPFDATALEGVDAVVHLAGENIAGGRWTEARKRTILASRRDGTDALARSLAALERPPSVVLSASAVGLYGDRGDEELSEDADPGGGFLPRVCVDWEAAAAPLREAGVRVVHPRIGIVLSSEGGVLARLLPLFRLALGGKVGDGRQWMSWILLDDLVRALLFAIDTPTLQGPMNAVAPHPVRNAEFTRALSAALGRPAVFGAPGWALGAAFGELADALLLASQRATPGALAAAGFTWNAPTLEQALAVELGGGSAPSAVP